MKSVHVLSIGHRLVTRTAKHPIGFADLIAWLNRSVLRSRGRSSLAELDDRLLRDIGKSRSEALRESGKPFWR